MSVFFSDQPTYLILSITRNTQFLQQKSFRDLTGLESTPAPPPPLPGVAEGSDLQQLQLHPPHKIPFPRRAPLVCIKNTRGLRDRQLRWAGPKDGVLCAQSQRWEERDRIEGKGLTWQQDRIYPPLPPSSVSPSLLDSDDVDEIVG